MVGKFKFVNTNSVAVFNLAPLSSSPFRFWVRFLTEYSYVRYALTEDAVFNHDALRECYCTAFESTEEEVLSFTFQLGNRVILVSELDLNRILQFPGNNFVPDPTTQELFDFFDTISYHVDEGVFSVDHLGDMYKHRFPKEWNFFFHTINHVFAPKKGGFHGLPNFIQKISYAVANNLRINYGKLLVEQILIAMGPLEYRDIQSYDVECLYPRFLQLVLNAVLTREDKLRYANSVTSPAFKLKNHVISSLGSRREYLNNNAAILTDFFRRCLDDMNSVNRQEIPQAEPIPEEAAQPKSIAQVDEEEAQVEPEGHAPEQQTITETYHPGSPSGNAFNTESNFLHGTVSLHDTIEPSVALGFDNEPENQQVPTHVIEPNTETETSQTLLPLKRKPDEHEGVGAFSAPNKEVSEISPAALPPAKARRMETEATASPSFSSQQDIELIKAHKQSLGSSSQQDESIEICLSARAPCTESNTESDTHLQTMLDLNVPIINALRGATYTQDELTAAIVLSSISRNETTVIDSEMNQAPLQASEGNLGSVPLIRPLSTLPEGTSLDPSRDLPSIEDGRQLDSVEVGDLRNPIAPSVTSLEGATMISYAGTTGARSSEGMSDTQTERLSDTLTLKPSENLERSGTPAERTSETPTLTQTAPPTITISQFEALSQRFTTLEANVSSMQRTLEEVNSQMKVFKDILIQLLNN